MVLLSSPLNPFPPGPGAGEKEFGFSLFITTQQQQQQYIIMLLRLSSLLVLLCASTNEAAPRTSALKAPRAPSDHPAAQECAANHAQDIQELFDRQRVRLRLRQHPTARDEDEDEDEEENHILRRSDDRPQIFLDTDGSDEEEDDIVAPPPCQDEHSARRTSEFNDGDDEENNASISPQQLRSRQVSILEESSDDDSSVEFLGTTTSFLGTTTSSSNSRNGGVARAVSMSPEPSSNSLCNAEEVTPSPSVVGVLPQGESSIQPPLSVEDEAPEEVPPSGSSRHLHSFLSVIRGNDDEDLGALSLQAMAARVCIYLMMYCQCCELVISIMFSSAILHRIFRTQVMNIIIKELMPG